MLLNCIFAVTLVLAATSSHASSIGRIVGGYLTNIEKFPFTVYVWSDTTGCTGVIVAPSVVVTAAHCLNKGKLKYIMAGTDDITKGGVGVNIIDDIIHPLFNRRTLDFDIALLKLEFPLEYSPRMRSVKLPASSNIIEVSNGTALGWGQTYNVNEKLNHLRALDLYVQRDCKYVTGRKILESMFCAGHPSGQKDTCVGDSGGPFVNDGVLYGLVSFGTPICAIGEPGVFVKVPLLVNWIKKNLKNF